MSTSVAETELPPNIRVLTTLASDDAGYSVSDAAFIRALSEAEDAHFWHACRNQFILDRLARIGARPPARFLELGCGGGSVAASLAHHSYSVVGVDGHLSRVREAARRAPQASFVVQDLRHGAGDIGEGFDVVGLFDVIEHLDEPRDALRLGLAHLRPGGWLVGTVPALMSLWSEVDTLVGHRKRYGATDLRETLAIEGTRLVEVLDFNRLLVLPMWLRRKQTSSKDATSQQIDDLAVPAAPVNWLMGAMLRMEYASQSLWSWLGVPGASLWFAVQKL